MMKTTYKILLGAVIIVEIISIVCTFITVNESLILSSIYLLISFLIVIIYFCTLILSGISDIKTLIEQFQEITSK